MANNRLFFILLTIFLVITSCNRIVNNEEDYHYYEEREGVVSLSLSSDQSNRTKSLYTESDMGDLNSVVIYGVDEVTGHWKRAYVTASAGSASTTMSFTVGHALTFYVLGNIPNDQAVFSVDSQGRLLPEDFVYMLPTSTNELKVTGIPMAKKVNVSANDFSSGNLVNGNSSWGVSKVGEYPLDVKLERLMAKVVVEIDKSDITGGQDEPVLASDHIAIRQANRRMRPFHPDGSKALSSADLFSGSLFDYENLSDNEDMMQTGIVLYVPENCQGELEDYNDWSTDTPSDLDGTLGVLCTYIEYMGSKDGSTDGVGGDVYYRGFLGGGSLNHSNFSVERNKSYTASLSLTWNGLVWTADGGWRINTDDVTDGRRLVLSSSNNSSSVVAGNSLGKIKREASRQVYVNFSRDGGSTWVHGLKDVPEWPYGWDFYIDGVKQYTGVSGTAQGQIGWSYAGSSSADVLSVTPGSLSTLNSSHTLQVKSKDGKVVSNEVSFEIGIPINLIWQNGNEPIYVAQRGKLIAEELENPSAEVVYTITSGSSKIRLTSTGDNQSKYVNFIGEGTATIHAECATTGQEGDMTVTVVAPELSMNYTEFYANPDGCDAMSATSGLSGSRPTPYYHVPGGSQVLSRSLVTGTNVVTGNFLAQDLYDELLAFTPSIYDNETGFLITNNGTGYEPISVHVVKLTSSTGDYPISVGGSSIGTLIVSPKVADTGIASTTADILSVNPFVLFGNESNIQIVTDKDIQDVSITEKYNNQFYRNWGYSLTTEYSTYCPSVNASSAYYGVEAFLNDDTESLPKLSDVFSGNPGGYISWKQVDKSRGTENGAGIVKLKAFVKNRYSNEKCYSSIFYKGRIFRHGGVVAYASNDYSIGERIMHVSARYYGEPNPEQSVYTSDGLGCAFPDIGTNRTNSTYRIDWSNYEQGMTSYEGYQIVELNSAPRKVTGIDSNGDGIGYLFDVTDGCNYDHWGLDATICHESYFYGISGDPRNAGVPGNGVRGAMMKFLPATGGTEEKQIIYEKHIKRITDELVFLKPTGAPTHKYMDSIDGCGFYVLHILNGFIENEWL